MEPHTTISSKTLEKLMNDEFKTFEELEEFDRNLVNNPRNIFILHRKIFNKTKDIEICIIETIFIDE